MDAYSAQSEQCRSMPMMKAPLNADPQSLATEAMERRGAGNSAGENEIESCARLTSATCWRNGWH